MDDRLANLRAKIAEQKLDALIVTGSENQLYLSGFSPTEYLDATMVISADHAIISTDSRYYEEVKQRAPDFKLFEAGYDRNKILGEFGTLASPKLVGFEARYVNYATFKDWSKAARKAGYKLKPVGGLVEELRAVKTAEELALIKNAAALTDEAFKQLKAVIKPGMTEKECAWVIESYMREHGAETVAFTPIVGSGPNGALPHGTPGDRKVQRGEPIVVDIGARVNAYNSDMTRTICLGKPDDKFKQIYGIVLKAQSAAIRRIKPAVKGKRVDALARNVIEKAGYGDNFGHGLGHGVGLQVHEAPSAGRLSKDVCRANMTLTVEPGIYLPGWGGVRIEDLVVIQENGVEILSKSPKDLRDMIIEV